MLKLAETQYIVEHIPVKSPGKPAGIMVMVQRIYDDGAHLSLSLSLSLSLMLMG
jgi:hypothetical protein